MTYITNKDFYLEVAKGLVANHSLIHKFGEGLVGTTLVPITDSLVYNMPTAAVALEVVSTSSADAQNGAGARKVTIQGLDASWNEITQVVSTHATDGTIAVAIPTSLLRVFRWYVSESGSYSTLTTGAHVGTLSIQVSGGGAVWSNIGITPMALGQSEIGFYTIPTGFTGYLLSKDIFVDSSRPVDIYFFQRPLADDVSTPFTGTLRLIQHEIGVTGAANLQTKAPKGPFVGPCDIGFMGKVGASTGNASVEYELLLIED